MDADKCKGIPIFKCVPVTSQHNFIDRKSI